MKIFNVMAAEVQRMPFNADLKPTPKASALKYFYSIT
jgi:hypothetical protein